MKCLLIAAEASSDIHAANLIIELNKKTKGKIEFFGIGGDRLINTGIFTPNYYYRNFSVFGFLEIFSKLRSIYGAFRFLKKQNYDFVILLDYPGFNIRLARHFYKKGVPVYYYISPKVWVWKKNRIYKLAKYCKKIITIFPFEKEFYKNYGIDVDYVGNPLIDEINNFNKEFNEDKKNKLIDKLSIKNDEKIIAVLPGSRISEIKYLMPVLKNVCALIKEKLNARFIIPVAKSLKKEDFKLYNEFFEIRDDINSYELFSISNYGIIASGTATLEAALFSLPFNIIYKVSNFSYFLFKHFIRYRGFIGLPNILLGKEEFKEFLQDNLEENNVANEVLDYFKNPKKINFNDLREKLYLDESPSALCSEVILESLKKLGKVL